MQVNYQEILDFMLVSGRRLATRAGKIADIGLTKADVTEEDLAIERGLKEIVSSFGPDHSLYSEEENQMFQKTKNVWAADPISGTKIFIEGKAHYGIVITHLIDAKAVFAAVYDPSVDEMFVAHSGQGALLNGQRISVSQGATKKVLFRQSLAWSQPEVTAKARNLLEKYELQENPYSMALNYCWVAAGRSDGIVSFTKDSFPEFAGGLIIREAGGKFTNLQGESGIQASDRIFVGGNKKIYAELYSILS